ncbi:hypothetical protein ONZ45_g1500 [Pleurotus djamor]|nr:hypothetical protein ONZ45_g1500 [Pleurotus djamor]
MFKTIILAILLASSAISTLTHPLISSDTRPSHNIQVLNKRIPSPLKDDLARFTIVLKAIEDEATNFPDEHPTLSDAVILQNRFTKLDENLKTYTSHVKALGSLSEADSREIISEAEMMVGGFESAMQAFMTKKHALQSFPLGSGVFTSHDNLVRLNDATMKKYEQFLFVFHNSTTCRIAVFKKRVHTIFQNTIDAYAAA